MVLTHIKHKRILMNPGPLQRILNADRYGATQACFEFGWIVTHPKSRETEVDRPAKAENLERYCPTTAGIEFGQILMPIDT